MRDGEAEKTVTVACVGSRANGSPSLIISESRQILAEQVPARPSTSPVRSVYEAAVTGDLVLPGMILAASGCSGSTHVVGKHVKIQNR